jgi:hypothetical protein
MMILKEKQRLHSSSSSYWTIAAGAAGDLTKKEVVESWRRTLEQPRNTQDSEKNGLALGVSDFCEMENYDCLMLALIGDLHYKVPVLQQQQPWT